MKTAPLINIFYTDEMLTKELAPFIEDIGASEKECPHMLAYDGLPGVNLLESSVGIEFNTAWAYFPNSIPRYRNRHYGFAVVSGYVVPLVEDDGYWSSKSPIPISDYTGEFKHLIEYFDGKVV